MISINRSLVTRRSFLKDATVASASAAFIAGIRPLFPSSAEGNERSDHWYRNIYTQHHYDAHLGEYNRIYQDFNAEASAKLFEEAGVQMVCFFAKGLYGYSYYPTKIGVVHPGLDRDFTGEMAKALKKRGIRCILYFYLAAERNLQKKHPDWIYGKGVTDESSIGELVEMCANSPYVEQVGIPQMKEIISLYEIDGFFIDIFFHQFIHPRCRCRYCRESFEKEVGGKIPEDDNDPKAFAYRKWLNRHMEAIMEKNYVIMSGLKPDIAIINNWAWLSRYPVTPPRYVKHITFDTPVPNYGMYAWNFSMETRYLATLADVLPDLTWSVMNTRMNTWGSYELRETEALMQECAIALAGCGRTYIGDVSFPSGNPDPAVMELCGEVNRRTLELVPFVKDCKPVKDVAVLHSADSVWSKGATTAGVEWTHTHAYHPVCGAHKALIEGHVQMGILNSEVFLKTINDYNTLILADQRNLSDRECESIRRFVKNGGALIATCETGTRDIDNNPLQNFSIADVLGVDYLESPKTQRCFLRNKSKNKKYGIPVKDVQTGNKFVRIKTTTAKTLLELVTGYEGKSAPAALHEGPGVTINTYGKGKAIYCAPQLFRTYFTADTPVLRKLALWMLDLLYPVELRSIIIENTPMNVEMFYNHRRNERFIHLINYSGDKREKGVPQVQDFTTVHGIRVRVRLDNKLKRVTAVPDGDTISFTYRNGWASFDAKPLKIHSVYKIEV